MYRSAKKDFDQALTSGKKHARLYENRGDLLSDMGNLAVDQGKDPRDVLDMAFSDYENALRLEPDRNSSRAAMAGACIVQGQYLEQVHADPRSAYEKGIAACDEVVRRGGASASILSTRGSLRMATAVFEAGSGKDTRGLLKKAQGDFSEALEKDPGKAYAYANRGKARYHVGKLEQARGIDPQEAFRKALEDVSAALRLEPGKSPHLFLRGNIHLALSARHTKHGEDPRPLLRNAVADYDACVQGSPYFVHAICNRGLAKGHLAAASAARGGDPEPLYRKALADYETVLKRNPGFWQALINGGLALEKLGRFEEALAFFRRVDLLFRGGDRYLNLYLQRGKVAVEGPPWFGKILQGVLHFDIGNFTKARSLFEAALPEAEKAGPTVHPAVAKFVLGAHFNLGCLFAQASAGKKAPLAPAEPVAEEKAKELRGKAVASLRKSLEGGFSGPEDLRKDPYLAPLRNDPEFLALLKAFEGR
jgi:tetratricopeptide (TPR) repeat protein